jgi:hypothetical protein
VYQSVSIFADFVLPIDVKLINPDALSPESPEQRESCVRTDLVKRLRCVCKDLPEEEFQDLVSAMTREQLRSERLH